MNTFILRLKRFLKKKGQPESIVPLRADASTREYFRIGWKNSSAVACVYPDPFAEPGENYLDVTGLFLKAGIPVADILDFDRELGVIILEDLGDVILRDKIIHADPAEKEHLIDLAIDLIPGIQAATDLARELGSVASKLKFDIEKLTWELEFFKTHYFSTFKKKPLDAENNQSLSRDFFEIAAELEKKATVLCHRDFHASNLMIDRNGKLRVIDHQDARIGSPTYDLVSLLLDRVTEPPTDEWLRQKRLRLLEKRNYFGLTQLDEVDFASEFSLQTIQRCLKAVGTFSYQSVNRGRSYFIPFIRPMFEIVLHAADALDRFPKLREVLQNELDQNEQI